MAITQSFKLKKDQTFPKSLGGTSAHNEKDAAKSLGVVTKDDLLEEGKIKQELLDGGNNGLIYPKNGVIPYDKFDTNQFGQNNLSGPVTVLGGSTHTYTIKDYNSFKDYTVTVDQGTATIEDNLVIVSFDTNASGYVTIVLDETPFRVKIEPVVVTGPTSGFAGLPIVFQIVNFSSFTDYHVSSTTGTVVRSNDLITVTPDPAFVGTMELKVNATICKVDIALSAVDKPRIVTPAHGSLSVIAPFTFTSSNFVSTLKESVSHLSSDWEISTDNEFTTVVASSYEDEVNKTSFTVSELADGVVHFARVRYRDTNGNVSKWSSVAMFTTASRPLSRLVYQDTANGRPFLSDTGETVTMFSILNIMSLGYVDGFWTTTLSESLSFSVTLVNASADGNLLVLQDSKNYYIRKRENGVWSSTTITKSSLYDRLDADQKALYDNSIKSADIGLYADYDGTKLLYLFYYNVETDGYEEDYDVEWRPDLRMYKAVVSGLAISADDFETIGTIENVLDRVGFLSFSPYISFLTTVEGDEDPQTFWNSFEFISTTVVGSSTDYKVNSTNYGPIVAPTEISDFDYAFTNNHKFDADGDVMAFSYSNSTNNVWVYRRTSPTEPANYTYFPGVRNCCISGDGLTLVCIKDKDGGNVAEIYRWLDNEWVNTDEVTIEKVNIPGFPEIDLSNVVQGLDYTGSTMLIYNSSAKKLYIYK